MTHASIPLIALLLLAGTVGAQQHGEIRGKVHDPDGHPLGYAHVYTEVMGSRMGTTTDMDGRFVLKPLPPGSYTITISFTGFTSRQITDVQVVAERATYLKDQHMAFIGAFDTLEVVGYRRKLIDIDDPSRMSLLAEEFRNDPNKRNPVAFIATNFPGVTATPNGDGLHFRGSRTNDMITFVDGIKVQGAMPRLPASAIGSVSVYTGGLPARYGDVTGGVIVIETKSYFDLYQRAAARAVTVGGAE